MKKTLLSVAALTLALGGVMSTAQAAAPGSAGATHVAKTAKPAAKHHRAHKHAAKKAS